MDAERRRDRAITPPSAAIVPYHLLPLQRKGFPICPYYAIRAHLRDKFRSIFLVFDVIPTVTIVQNTQFSSG